MEQKLRKIKKCMMENEPVPKEALEGLPELAGALSDPTMDKTFILKIIQMRLNGMSDEDAGMVFFNEACPDESLRDRAREFVEKQKK